MKRRTASLMLCMAAAGTTAVVSLSGTGAQAMTYANGDGSVCHVEGWKYGAPEPEQAGTERDATTKELEKTEAGLETTETELAAGTSEAKTGTEQTEINLTGTRPGTEQVETNPTGTRPGTELTETNPAGTRPDTETVGTGQSGTKSFETEREQKDLENWQKAQLREEIAPLKEYGVAFDEEQECLLYQGQKIRLLIDEQIEDTYSSIQMPDGEIDLYTVRSEDYSLAGVRIASQEEYDRHTESLQESTSMFSAAFGEEAGDAAYTWENPWHLETGVVFEDTVTIAENEDRTAEDMGIQAEDDTAAAASDVPEDTVSSIAQEAIASGSAYDTPSEEEKKRIAEYEAVGIERNSHGGWLYQGKEIDWMVDENGGIYMTNENKDRKDRLYVVVRRNEDGSVREAEEVTLEDAIRSYVESGT